MEVKEYLSKIGRKGGKSKSLRKSESSRRNAEKARAAKLEQKTGEIPPE